MDRGKILQASRREASDRSGAAKQRNRAAKGDLSEETDRDLSVVDDDGHLLHSPGQAEHLLPFLRVFIDIEKDRPLPVGQPGLFREGSGLRPVDDDFLRHAVTPPVSTAFAYDRLHRLNLDAGNG
jgi:hypothetical protein